MNRPNRNDYEFLNWEYHNTSIGRYTKKLELYCDELEEENSKLYCLKDKRFEELTKALDKACELLSLSMPYLPISKCPKDIDCFNGGHLKNKEEWIATCLDDEEKLNDSWKPKVIER